jgi:hypothetical protein
VKKNMGGIDRTIRILLALVVLGLALTGQIGGVLAIVLLVLAGIFVLTSLVGTCPLYMPLGLSTCKRTEKSVEPAPPGGAV